MNSPAVAEFVCEWSEYLKQHGHAVKQIPNASNIVRSRNTCRYYRWVTLLARRGARRLTAIERQHFQQQLRLARRNHEKLYVVVKFDYPTQKVGIIPAEAVLETGRIRSNKGGIPWD
ncbi:MAG TPA: hypothetical protein VMZ31_20335 [Phycisphaerae bacterium]|nr:hypothetical protein [Phycisphaerae bacterium]